MHTESVAHSRSSSDKTDLRLEILDFLVLARDEKRNCVTAIAKESGFCRTFADETGLLTHPKRILRGRRARRTTRRASHGCTSASSCGTVCKTPERACAAPARCCRCPSSSLTSSQLAEEDGQSALPPTSRRPIRQDRARRAAVAAQATSPCELACPADETWTAALGGPREARRARSTRTADRRDALLLASCAKPGARTARSAKLWSRLFDWKRVGRRSNAQGRQTAQSSLNGCGAQASRPGPACASCTASVAISWNTRTLASRSVRRADSRADTCRRRGVEGDLSDSSDPPPEDPTCTAASRPSSAFEGTLMSCGHTAACVSVSRLQGDASAKRLCGAPTFAVATWRQARLTERVLVCCPVVQALTRVKRQPASWSVDTDGVSRASSALRRASRSEAGLVPL